MSKKKLAKPVQLPATPEHVRVSKAVQESIFLYYRKAREEDRVLPDVAECRLNRSICSLAVEWVCRNWAAVNPALA